jgi:hypothetical protein
MKAQLFLIAASLMIVGCDSAKDASGTAPQASSETGQALDKLAIEKGILPDINNLVFAGRFETRSELGTDKFCAVKSGNKSYKIGVLAVFGPESKCEGQGTASVDGEKVRISLNGKENCRFDAEFDGIELRFPGGLEQGCESYCTARASLSGTSYFIVEQGDDNARRALGRDIELLCG